MSNLTDFHVPSSATCPGIWQGRKFLLVSTDHMQLYLFFTLYLWLVIHASQLQLYLCSFLFSQGLIHSLPHQPFQCSWPLFLLSSTHTALCPFPKSPELALIWAGIQGSLSWPGWQVSACCCIFCIFLFQSKFAKTQL